MDKGLYLEICIICILIMVLLIHSLKRQYMMLLEDVLFKSVIWIALCLFLSDGIWALIDGVKEESAYFFNQFINIVYFILTGLIGALWLVYTDYRIYRDEGRLKKNAALYSIPFAVLTFLTLASPWTGWIFQVRPENNYLRGTVYFMQMVIVYGYLIWAVIQSLVASNKADSRYHKKEFRTLAAFTILPVIGGIAQGLVKGYPLVWAGTAISILMVFINLQNQQISKDGLTGINNRRYLNCYLDARISSRHRKKKLYFILMDIDSFKEINDTYGHIEGDAAIIRITGILKQVCSTNNDFLARYGGDEFAIVCERDDCQEIENLFREINEIMDLSNSAGGMEYSILLSIGYAELGETVLQNQDQLIALADKRLYEVKRGRKICVPIQ